MAARRCSNLNCLVPEPGENKENPRPAKGVSPRKGKDPDPAKGSQPKDDPLRVAHLFVKTMERNLSHFMIGQMDARKALAAFAFRLALEQGKPSMCRRALFLGPSGCGKTLAARTFARVWLAGLPEPDKGGLLEVEFTRHMEWTSGADLFGNGAKSGTVGTFVASHPTGVILCKDLEQAHPSVLAALLPILDGEVGAGSQGAVLDYRQIIFIFISRIGRSIWDQPGGGCQAFSLDPTALLNGQDLDGDGQGKADRIPRDLVSRLCHGPMILFRPPRGHHHIDLLIQQGLATLRCIP